MLQLAWLWLSWLWLTWLRQYMAFAMQPAVETKGSQTRQGHWAALGSAGIGGAGELLTLWRGREGACCALLFTWLSTIRFVYRLRGVFGESRAV